MIETESAKAHIELYTLSNGQISAMVRILELRGKAELLQRERNKAIYGDANGHIRQPEEAQG